MVFVCESCSVRVQTIEYGKKLSLLVLYYNVPDIIRSIGTYRQLTIYVESPLANNLGDSKVIHYWPLTRVCQLIKPYVHIYIHTENHV